MNGAGLLARSEELAEDFKGALGPELASLSLHGLETPLFWPAHCLAVIKPLSTLHRAHGAVAKWRRRGLEPPLFLTGPEVARLPHAFPLELLHFKLDTRQVVGDDLLASLEPDLRRLGEQCVRELHGKVVVLRRAYAMSVLPEEISALLAASLPLYLAVFRGVALCERGVAPLDAPGVLSAAGRSLPLNAGLWRTLVETATGPAKGAAKGTAKKTQRELHELLADYVAEAERLAQAAENIT